MRIPSFGVLVVVAGGFSGTLLLPSRVVALACPAKNGAVIIGEAKSMQTENLLYCEYHFTGGEMPSSRGSETHKFIKYYDPNDQLIADKSIDYASGLLSPSVTQNDYRHGEMRIVKQRDTSRFSMSYRKPNVEEKPQSVMVKASPSLVIDAGFDDAIRQSWDRLMAGEKTVFSFASPVHARTVGLRVKKTDRKDCGNVDYQKESQVCYRIGAASTVLSMFFKPLALVYDKDTQRLVRFAGQVNITTIAGKTQSAVINYRYN